MDLFSGNMVTILIVIIIAVVVWKFLTGALRIVLYVILVLLVLSLLFGITISDVWTSFTKLLPW